MLSNQFIFMKPVSTVKIVRNGRITLPKEFRDKYNWKEGDLLMIYDIGGNLRIEKLK